MDKKDKIRRYLGRPYEVPKSEIVVLDKPCVLCGSGRLNGGTENMDMRDIELGF